MHTLRLWAAMGGFVGLCGLGLACRDTEGAPSAQEREVRSEVLRDLISSRERLPSPEELQAQRRQLQPEVRSEPSAQGDAGGEVPTASITGRVEWVGDNELLFRDEEGVEREVRVEGETRFVATGRGASRQTLAEGAEIRVTYEVRQGEWVAREVELLRKPPPSGEGRGEGAMSPPPRGEPR